MIHQAPAGARDLLPLEVAQKGWINDRLQSVFQSWGYQRIVTSTIEWLDTLMAGGAIERETAIEIVSGSSRRLGLRPELTASIARAAMTRMAGSTDPQRLCYRANVFRNTGFADRGQQLEFYQAGVELLFAAGALADAEILLLLADSLRAVGIVDWQIILGDVGLTKSLLSPFPEPERSKVSHYLAKLDRLSLEKIALADDLKARALSLFDLRGKPEEVFAKLDSLHIDSEAKEILDRLRHSIDLLQQSSPQPISLILDLSPIENFQYYTGIVFEVVSRNDRQLRVLAKGGRYDSLLALYHPQQQPAPGIGFSLYIEELHACLLNSNILPQSPPTNDWLVVPKTPTATAAAFIHASKLRDSANLVRVEVDLGGRTPTEIRDYARNCRIEHLAWVLEDGTSVVENLQEKIAT
jgi:ATP phosphoribosyltransferase regulatory subunit